MDYTRSYPWGITIKHIVSILRDTNPPTVVYIGFAGGSNYTTKDKEKPYNNML
jgi:hypothetical protein